VVISQSPLSSGPSPFSDPIQCNVLIFYRPDIIVVIYLEIWGGILWTRHDWSCGELHSGAKRRSPAGLSCASCLAAAFESRVIELHACTAAALCPSATRGYRLIPEVEEQQEGQEGSRFFISPKQCLWTSVYNVRLWKQLFIFSNEFNRAFEL
jgi:hypothetical protein